MTDTPLNVSFHEKDHAKQLGARWNPVQGHWYVPAGNDVAPFARWLPSSSESLPEVGTGYSLRELLQRIQRVVQPAFAAPVWVRAEVADAKFRNGHVYLALVERTTKEEVARIQAVLWRSTAQSLLTRFQRQTGGDLTAGLQVLVQVQVEVRERHGLQLRILDLDPRYTLGEMAVKLRAIRAALQRENLFDRNRQLALPRDYFRVAVVSPDGAAGLGDFRVEAERLERYGICRFHYFPALFQGPSAKTSLSAALAQAVATPGIDAMVILRGGGSAADLHWLNEDELARVVCLSPVPVLTGIGHEQDRTVLDEVACRALGTPSKVIHLIEETIQAGARQAEADFQAMVTIIQRIADKTLSAVEQEQRDVKQAAARQIATVTDTMETSRRTVTEESRRRVTLATRAVREHHQQLLQDANQSVTRAERAIAERFGQIQAAARAQVDARTRETKMLQADLLSSVHRGLAQATDQLDAAKMGLETEVHAATRRARREVERLTGEVLGLGPQRTLQRGFALVRDRAGPLITSRAAALPHSHLTIEFHDGCLAVQQEPLDDDDESRQL